MSERLPFSILIIEDDADTRSNLVDILEFDGYELLTAGTAAEALRRDDWSRLFAIILDRRLPDGSGQELLPHLRKLAPEAAIVVVTGYSDLEGAIAALRQGAADYIIKPVDPETLRSRLARIAEHWRVREVLQQTQQKLVQSERLAAIGEMMTGLAHESRNALQRSQACLEMLALEVHDRPAALDLLGRIQQAQDHLHFLYEEVRTFAAPIHLRRELCAMRELLEQTWDHLAPSRQGRQAALRFEEGEMRPEVPVDKERLEQVVRNILENSLSACADPVCISVRFSEEWLGSRSALRVSIADNGPGLTAEQRMRIFEPFYTTKTRGTGLGMAIAHRIVEAHGGTIKVGSEHGLGAEIVLLLPRTPL